MKYFIDTEFIAGFHKPLFGKRRHFIDLVSIGIYCEDGREYYAISNEYNPMEADQWVKENVLLPLIKPYYVGAAEKHTDELIKIKVPGSKSLEEIKNDIIIFILDPLDKKYDEWYENSDRVYIPDYLRKLTQEAGHNEFWGYYSDYDWVVFCSLFGRMVDLPKGFPMYCRDLKQSFDEMVQANTKSVLDKLKAGRFPISDTKEREVFKELSESCKKDVEYPKHVNEHNALDDAKWNFGLHQYIYDAR